MRTSCPLCGSVACMLQSPAFCRTTRQSRAPGTTPVMPAGVVARPSAMFAPAAPATLPFAAYESHGALLASAASVPSDPEDEDPEPTPAPPRRRLAGRTRR